LNYNLGKKELEALKELESLQVPVSQNLNKGDL